ncbi:hypothetical protein AO286_00270 [Pseudomonas syringae]|nr:hypothetical protein AO286_00270 [Pseudomonas syringae]
MSDQLSTGRSRATMGKNPLHRKGGQQTNIPTQATEVCFDNLDESSDVVIVLSTQAPPKLNFECGDFLSVEVIDET